MKRDGEARRVRTVRRHLRLPPTPRTAGVWAVTVVRDEADVIGQTVDHLLEQGISRIVVVDHRSSDATAEVLATRAVTVIPYRHEGYAQSAIMTALARHAAAHGADWVIPFDADEIWSTRDGSTLAEHLAARHEDAVEAQLTSYVPTTSDPDDPDPLRRLVTRFREPDGLPKVAFRAAASVTVGMGNHAVHPQGTTGGGLVIAHYPYRSREQFARKVRQGRAGLDAAKLPPSRSALAGTR